MTSFIAGKNLHQFIFTNNYFFVKYLHKDSNDDDNRIQGVSIACNTHNASTNSIKVDF